MHETAEQMQERIVELQGELATARRDNLYLRDKAAGMDALRKENDLQRGDLRNERDKVRHLEEKNKLLTEEVAKLQRSCEQWQEAWGNQQSELARLNRLTDGTIDALKALVNAL